jgi:NTP pyrophosphatase (non-canonical NTP hydrolase)
MNIDTYQTEAMKLRLPTADRTYAMLNLAAEAGEVLGKAAKLRRDGGDVKEYNTAIKKELGDVMWQAAAVAQDHGFTLSEVCQHNLDKLWGRKDKGTLQGSGDLR